MSSGELPRPIRSGIDRIAFCTDKLAAAAEAVDLPAIERALEVRARAVAALEPQVLRFRQGAGDAAEALLAPERERLDCRTEAAMTQLLLVLERTRDAAGALGRHGVALRTYVKQSLTEPSGLNRSG